MARRSAKTRTGSSTERRLATVFFTDMVGSTELAAQLGDRRWKALLAAYHRAVRLALRNHRGREVDNAGDGREAIDAELDFTLIGATPEELRSWGYRVSSVPSVQDRIDQCLPLVGEVQTRCWTTLDQYMVEKVAAVVPFVAETYTELVPKRITLYSYDEYVTLPALDRLAVR